MSLVFYGLTQMGKQRVLFLSSTSFLESRKGINSKAEEQIYALLELVRGQVGIP